ncbi:MAG: caspase family protein [Bacteroidota bacterium]
MAAAAIRNNNIFRKGKDYALFFAIDQYQDAAWADLVHPISEVEDLAIILHDNFDFDTTVVRNPTKEQIDSTLLNWQQKEFIEDAQVFVFFSGHGDFDEWYQSGYFIPANGSQNNRNKQIPLKGLENLVTAIPCNHILLGIDACYSGTIDPLVADRASIRKKIEDINQRLALIKRQLNYNSSLFLTSGENQRTPDKSRFMMAIQRALKEAYTSADGICAFEDIKSHLIRVNPKPHAGILRGHDGGGFVFVTKPSIFKESIKNNKNSVIQQIQRGIYFFWVEDYEQAFKILHQHRKSPHFSTEAMNRLGIMYIRGLGTTRNEKEGKKYFEKAALLGDYGAAYNLGIYYQITKKSDLEAIYWYKKSAEGGYVLGQLKLATCYMNGLGIKQDIKKAIRWLEKAALKGNATAKIMLGQLYLEGRGVTQSYSDAFNLFKQAAKQGDAEAQLRAGLMHLEGVGTEKNYYQARKLLSRSAAQGKALASYNLALIYANGWGIAVNKPLALKFMREAASKGIADARKALNRLE